MLLRIWELQLRLSNTKNKINFEKNKQQKDVGVVSLTACDIIYKYVYGDNLTFTEKKSYFGIGHLVWHSKWSIKDTGVTSTDDVSSAKHPENKYYLLQNKIFPSNCPGVSLM
jgi:hypothetical protein